MQEIVAAVILFALSGAAFFVSIRSFMEKGFLLNNAYLYASRQERAAMDKKPYYRQSAIVFLLLGLIFLLNGVDVLLKSDWIAAATVAIVFIAAVYAVISGIAIEKKNKQA